MARLNSLQHDRVYFSLFFCIKLQLHVGLDSVGISLKELGGRSIVDGLIPLNFGN